MFLLINYKTKHRLLCSWFPQDHNTYYHGQLVQYIGITGGLGGFRRMIDRGYMFREPYQGPLYFTNNLKKRGWDCIRNMNVVCESYCLYKKLNLLTDEIERKHYEEYNTLCNKIKNINLQCVFV